MSRRYYSICFLLGSLAVIGLLLAFYETVVPLTAQWFNWILAALFATSLLLTRCIFTRRVLIPSLIILPVLLVLVYSVGAADVIMHTEHRQWFNSLPYLISILDQILAFWCPRVFKHPESGGVMATLLSAALLAIISVLAIGNLIGLVTAPKRIE